MKKLLNIAMVLAIGVLGMSCTKENNPNEEESGVYTFTAKAVDIAGADATKTYLGTDGLQALWTGNEVLHLAYVKNNEAKTVDAALDQACKGTTDAVFTLKAEDATALEGVETVYPYIASGSDRQPTEVLMYNEKLYMKTYTKSNFDNLQQKPTADSYDSDKDVLVGEPIQVSTLNPGEPVVLKLTRPVTLLKLVPQFESTALELIKDAQITSADVGIFGGGYLSGGCGYSWEDKCYLKKDIGPFWTAFPVATSNISLGIDKPIYLFCFPLANAELTPYSHIKFSLNFSNGYVFSSWKKDDASSEIRIKQIQPDFHLDAGKIHTITFTVKAERMTKN